MTDTEVHRYKLLFDNGPDEFVSAAGPTEAVKARTNPRLPYAITDETVMASWVRDMRGRPSEGQEATFTVEDQPIVEVVTRVYPPKDLTGGRA